MITELKQREYLVQVTVIEARHLAAKDDGSSNPFVKMKVGNLPVQVTERLDRNLNPSWNQSFTFSGLELNEQEFQTAELQFQVLSRNNFFGNDNIGEYAINLSTLYKNANHEYFNVWLCLTNPDEDDDSGNAQGYLLVDCFIIGEGDRPPVHSINDKLNTDVEEEDEDFNIDALNFDQLREYQEKKMGIQVLGKPTVARKAFQLSSFVFKADGLIDFPGMFSPEKPTFFVSCRSMGLVQRTKAVGGNSAPTINQKMLFPTYFPFLNDKIIMRCWNYQKGGSDKFIANIPEFTNNNDLFNISKLMSMGGRMPAKWINLYGIPPTERNDYISGPRRKHPLSGTAFLGRVLISFTLLPNPTPTFDMLPCNPFFEPDVLNYRLHCDIYQIKFLKDYEITVWCECSIGIYKTGSNKKLKPNKKNSVEWKVTDEKNDICLPSIIQNFPKDIASVPDIFINLFTGDGSSVERIGYYRVPAAKVIDWEPLPRWLHFNSLDTTKDSPGSVLTNLQFMINTETSKRIFKQKGITKYFKLYALIVSGFELDSKSGETSVETLIEVDIDGKTARTEPKKGNFPFWNSLLKIDVELDDKLDFAPDISVSLLKRYSKAFGDFKYEAIGSFTVPIWCCKKKKTLPHYFNFIKNNESIGRMLGLFFIDPQNKKRPINHSFEIHEALKQKYIADVQVSILGVRNLDFEARYKELDLSVEIFQDSAPTLVQNKAEDDKDIAALNSEEKENLMNFVQLYEFKDVEIYGDKNFQIYPLMNIKLIKRGVFGDEERYVMFNLSDYSNTISERTKKKYKKMFECNLGVKTVDQEQFIMTELGEKVEEHKEEKGLGEDYDEDDDPVNPTKDEITAKLAELEDDEEFDASVDKKMVVKLETYKNNEISDVIELSCMPKDKNNERDIKKNLRRKIFFQLKELKKKDLLSPEDTDKMLSLNEKFRELKKPLMNEDIFYGFDDLADEYDYGRDIYTEDVYETHPDLRIPFQTRKMLHIPRGFGEKFERMDGYFRLGKETQCLLKYNVNLIIKNENEEEERERLKEEEKAERKKRKKKDGKEGVQGNGPTAEDDDDLKKEIKQYNIYNPYHNMRMRNIYANKKKRKELKPDAISFQMNSIVVRVYILRALNLTAQDNFASFENMLSGFSSYCKANSYLELMLGEKFNSDKSKQVKYVDDRMNYKENTLNPSFFSTFILEGDLPADWKLTINVRSKKDGQLGQGTLIGSTIIDIEDRYIGELRNTQLLAYKAFEDLLNKEIETGDEEKIGKKLSLISSKVEELKSKQIPVEYRPLYNPDRKTAQGILEMFVEVLSSQQAKVNLPAKIAPKPPQEFELRLVIWEALNLPIDAPKKTLTVYLTCSFKPEGWLSAEIKKETDSHGGCDDGWAVWNWRMKFPFIVPCTFPRLYLNCIDFNVFKGDETIGEAYISFKRVFKKLLQEGQMTIEKKWIPFSHPKDPGEPKGELNISIFIVDKFEADQNPVGESWDEPNRNPFLERPTAGRGLGDFLKGISFPSFNWDFLGFFKFIAILGAVAILVVILFVSPGILV